MLEGKLKLLVDFVDNYFSVLLIVVSTMIFFLNYNSDLMGGIVSRYIDYKEIISGFDKNIIEASATPTFPMWGYGWVFTITENRFLIFLFQIITANAALLYLLMILKKNELFDSGERKFFQLLILISVPYFAINITLTPYGLAITLFIVSVSFLLKGLHEDKVRYFFISGALFGLTLNFRSDLLYFPILLFGIIFFVGKVNRIRKTIRMFFPWFLAAFIVLAPWGIYTKHVTGHYLLGSTNSGHVLYIGLGQLPDNVWGITAIDGDPVMKKEIEQHFGELKSSLIYETDVFLKKSFIEKVKEEPVEYLKKCLHSLVRSLVDGAYSGEYYLFSTDPSSEAKKNSDIKYREWRAKVMSSPTLLFDGLSGERFFQAVVELFVVFMKFFSLLLLPFTIWYGVRERNFFSLLVSSVIVYQVAILVFAYNMRLYNANVYIFHMMNIVLAYSYLKCAVSRE